MIKLFKPERLSGKYLDEVLKGGQRTTGPMVERLRTELAARFKWPRAAIALGVSGTACFQAIVDHVGSKKIDWHTEATWPLLLDIVERAHEAPFAPSVSVYTDIGGQCYNETFIREGQRGNVLIYDCCHGWEPCRQFDYSFASFYPTKLCGGVEGGVIFCRNEPYGVKLQQLLNCGIRLMSQRPEYDSRDRRGRKANMSDVSAALNLEALERLDRRKAAIGAVHRSMVQKIAKVSPIELVHHQPWQPYLLQIIVDDVMETRRFFESNGVATGWNFPPAKLVTLPCYPELSSEEIDRIVGVAGMVGEMEKTLDEDR